MKTKSTLITIIGLFAISMSAFANNNSATLVAPAAKVFIPSEAVLEIAKAEEAPVAENTVLAQSKAEALSMSGLKLAMVNSELLNKDVVKQLEQFQAQIKVVEDQIQLDKEITESK